MKWRKTQGKVVQFKILENDTTTLTTLFFFCYFFFVKVNNIWSSVPVTMWLTFVVVWVFVSQIHTHLCTNCMLNVWTGPFLVKTRWIIFFFVFLCFSNAFCSACSSTTFSRFCCYHKNIQTKWVSKRASVCVYVCLRERTCCSTEPVTVPVPVPI